MHPRFLRGGKVLAIKKIHTGYLVARTDDMRHSHFKRYQSCRQLIHLIELGLMPRNEYMRTAARRVLNDDEWERLKDCNKQRYVNKKGW